MAKDNSSNKENKNNKIIIEGVTPQGQHFRPSDWAERMSGILASFKNHRTHYSPLLRPSVNGNGHKCVVLDPRLKQTNPSLYQSIIDFAITNKLKICGKEDLENDPER